MASALLRRLLVVNEWQVPPDPICQGCARSVPVLRPLPHPPVFLQKSAQWTDNAALSL